MDKLIDKWTFEEKKSKIFLKIYLYIVDDSYMSSDGKYYDPLGKME